MSTLRFGTRAKQIKNRVRVNKQLSPEQLAAKLDALVRYVAVIEKENEDLKAENQRLKAKPSGGGGMSPPRRTRSMRSPTKRPKQGLHKRAASSRALPRRGRGGGSSQAARRHRRGSPSGASQKSTRSARSVSSFGAGSDSDEDASSAAGSAVASTAGGGWGTVKKPDAEEKASEPPMQMFVRQQLQMEQQQQMIGELLAELASAQSKQGQLDVRPWWGIDHCACLAHACTACSTAPGA